MALAQVASQAGQYMNVCTPLLIQKYNWDTPAKENLNESLINTIPAIGTICGSAFGSIIMQRGRAKAFILALLVGIFGGVFTLIENYPLFLASKFVVGASVGMQGPIVARYIEEYVPLKWFGTSQAICIGALQGGVLLATAMSYVLPPNEDT